LMVALQGVPDQRRAAGRRYPLPAVLAFLCCGLLCGNKSLLAIAEWGQAHQAWCCTVFGFRRRTPCVSTLHRVLTGLDVGAFELALRVWISALPVEAPIGLEPVAIDGKAVRGAKEQHLPGAYLLSAFASRRGTVLAQLGIGERENELSQALPLLRQVALRDVVVTGDAMFAQRSLCAHIVEQGGHYLFEVKANQPALALALQRRFATVQAAAGARTIEDGHGRIDIRTLHSRPGLEDGWPVWPGLEQICRLVHQSQRRGRWHTEVHDKITSLRPEQAGPADLLHLSRGHWAIENKLHYVRDVTLGEDASRIRRGAAPQAMAAMRNLVLALLHRAGMHNRAAGLRHFAWYQDHAAETLGLRCPQSLAAARVA